MSNLIIRQYGQRAAKGQGGFTLVELMIAMTLFAVVLLIVLSGVVQIGRYYYKGLTISRTHNAARSTIDEVSQAIQFNGDAIYGPSTGNGFTSYCVGTKRFSYKPHLQLTDKTPAADQTSQAFIGDTIIPTSSCPSVATQPLSANPRELLAPGMRPSFFEIKQVGVTQLWQISLVIAFGDQDVLDDYTLDKPQCKGGAVGTQFCAITALNTTVEKRL